jgi:hemerythrin superfamily protein
MSDNGIEFLKSQHRKIETMLESVSGAPGTERQERFDELRELLAVHETAEELILRPLTRKAVENGDEIADARFAEENEAKEVLAKLEKMDASTDEFRTEFDAFAADVKKHAQNEETYEFDLVEQSQDANALAKLGTALETAEKAAPTHAHPSAKTTTANVVLGPFASILDRVRDAMSKAS